MKRKSGKKTRRTGGRILVAEDISSDPAGTARSEAVRACAMRLALRLGNSVDLLHVDDLGLYPARAASAKPMIDRYMAEKKARLGAAAATAGGARTKALFLHGVPALKIAQTAAQGKYDLIALGTQGRAGISRLLLGSVAEEVVRHSRVPVMTIGPEALPRCASFLPSGAAVRILVPTTLTANSDRAETYAVALARRLGAEILLFHSLREALHPVLQTAFSVPSPPKSVSDWFAETKERAFVQLEREAAKLAKAGTRARPILDSSAILSSDAILDAAKAQGADLIVMGTHGRSLIGGAFFGRTAREVILRSTTPVVTVRSRVG